LIEAVYRAADDQGAERVYWHTENTNDRAQHLYRQVAELTPFVQYRASARVKSSRLLEPTDAALRIGTVVVGHSGPATQN
jgi:ribosomal protein S18 acetylase RimI-like enzyme